MNQGGRQSTSAPSSANPYQGAGRVIINNTSAPDKIFGTSMPTGQTNPAVNPGPGVIYGSDNYINPNLQGYSQTAQNIVNVDQLANQVAPMTPDNIERLRRGNLGQSTMFPQPTPQPVQPTPVDNPNQMYMQPPVIPQINDLPPVGPASANTTPMPSGVNGSAPSGLPASSSALDYLNSISPVTPTKKSPLPIPNKLFVVVGVAVIGLVGLVAIVGALGNTGGGLNSKAQDIGKAIANLQSIVDYGESNSSYINSDLDAVTAESHLVILSHQVQLGNLIPLAVDEEGEATEAEADESVTETLDKAKAQGNLSSTYQSELEERLTAIATSLQNAYEATGKEDVKTALNSAYIDVNNLLSRTQNAVASTGGEAAD